MATNRNVANLDKPDEARNENVPNEETVKDSRSQGPRVVERHRLYHSVGGGYTDFESEADLLEFVKDATTVKVRRNPDGSKDNVFSPNAHLVHGAAHPDYSNLVVSKVYEVEFPDEENE